MVQNKMSTEGLSVMAFGNFKYSGFCYNGRSAVTHDFSDNFSNFLLEI